MGIACLPILSYVDLTAACFGPHAGKMIPIIDNTW